MVSVLSRVACGVMLSVNMLCFVILYDAFVSCTNSCSCFVGVVIFFTCVGWVDLLSVLSLARHTYPVTPIT